MYQLENSKATVVNEYYVAPKSEALIKVQVSKDTQMVGQQIMLSPISNDNFSYSSFGVNGSINGIWQGYCKSFIRFIKVIIEDGNANSSGRSIRCNGEGSCLASVIYIGGSINGCSGIVDSNLLCTWIIYSDGEDCITILTFHHGDVVDGELRGDSAIVIINRTLSLIIGYRNITAIGL